MVGCFLPAATGAALLLTLTLTQTLTLTLILTLTLTLTLTKCGALREGVRLGEQRSREQAAAVGFRVRVRARVS